MQKVTQANKNTFFRSASVGEMYSFSRSICLQEIKLLAKRAGISINYISTYQFRIKEREQSISSWQPEEDDLCHGYETGFCGQKAITCIGNSKQGYFMFCRACAYKIGKELIDNAFSSNI